MSIRKVTYHSTPIYYVNDVPHPGHAYTTMAADALARARRLRGGDVYFLTGTDEHGQNIERIAREKGVPEQQHCDEIAAVFKQLWERLEIRYDRFIRTTDDIHVKGVLALWERMRTAKCADDGQPAVYRGRYAGLYCPRCEAFKTEDELRQPGNICPDHERPAEWTEEENFFFRLSGYQKFLEQKIESGELLIEPDFRRNEVLSVLRSGLQDFSISRARVKWGIPVPEDPGHVFYVWMDALSNYVTALGFADGAPEYARYWEKADERLHFVGKEITRFHCLYWPAMLAAAGVPLPTRVFAHGFITKGGRKLSKSTGNTIDPGALIDRYGSDATRYFFLREGTFGHDWDFTDEAFFRRFNADLANDLGNLVSRALTMVQRYCGGEIPARPGLPRLGHGLEMSLQLEDELRPRLERTFAAYDALDFSGALGGLWAMVSELNQRIVAVQPWVLAEDPSRREELHAFLYRLAEAVRIVVVLASPVMPGAARRVLRTLSLPAEPSPEDLGWGRLVPGAALGPIEPLFPRLEGPKTAQKTKEKTVSEEKPPAAPSPAPAPAPAPAPVADKIDIADFMKVELRAARIVAAEKVAKSKKLVKMQVDLGDEQRQVVAGIAESYEPEQLVGKTVILVANLKPAQLMGVESNGMVLAGSIGGKAILCGFEADVAPGTKVK
jgi:methionyl-tRNA synthetase